jgi:hypothetical protein
MIEYQIILIVWHENGQTTKKVISTSDRENAISKYSYIGQLVGDKKRAGELRDWCDDNDIKGKIIGTEGLFGVSYVKIL